MPNLQQKMTSAPSIKKSLALSTAYQVLSLIVPLISTPYISRVLGADGVGIYSFTSSIATYFTMFAALGTMGYGAREIARARDDRKRLSQLFWEIESLVVLSTLVCTAAWSIWIMFAPEYNILYVILTMTLLNTIADISWFFTGMELFKYIVLRNSTVKIAGVILLFILIKEKSDLELYVFLMSLTTITGSLSMWLYIPKFVNRVDWKTLHIKRHFKETLVYFFPAVATSIYTVLNKVLLGFMGEDIRENGYYEMVTRIITMAQALTYAALNSVLGSRISYLFSENKIEEIHQRINKSLHYILFVGLGMSFGIMAISPIFIPWFFGTDFSDAVLLLQLLSPIVLIIGISNCLGSQYYIPAGLRKKSAQYIVVGSALNLLLNILLIPYYGAIGAVVGSLVAESSITLLYLWNCNGFMKIEQIARYGWDKIVAALLMFFWIHILSNSIADPTWSIIISIITGASIYTLLLLLFKDTFMIGSVKYVYNKIMNK